MSARDAEDVVNVAFDQWDQYATRVAAENIKGMTFGTFVRERLSAAGYEIVPREPTDETDGKSAYRNAFVTQRDSATGQVWEALVARGLAEARDSYEFGDMTVYHVTDLGRSKT